MAKQQSLGFSQRLKAQHFSTRWHRLSRPHFLQLTRYSNPGKGSGRPQQDVFRQTDGPKGQNRPVQIFAGDLPRRHAEVCGGLHPDVRRLAREPRAHLEREVQGQA